MSYKQSIKESEEASYLGKAVKKKVPFYKSLQPLNG